jgi:hypothetical protein
MTGAWMLLILIITNALAFFLPLWAGSKQGENPWKWFFVFGGANLVTWIVFLGHVLSAGPLTDCC